jgi:hypothetical protein
LGADHSSDSITSNDNFRQRTTINPKTLVDLILTILASGDKMKINPLVEEIRRGGSHQRIQDVAVNSLRRRMKL